MASWVRWLAAVAALTGCCTELACDGGVTIWFDPPLQGPASYRVALEGSSAGCTFTVDADGEIASGGCTGPDVTDLYADDGVRYAHLVVPEGPYVATLDRDNERIIELPVQTWGTVDGGEGSCPQACASAAVELRVLGGP